MSGITKPEALSGLQYTPMQARDLTDPNDLRLGAVKYLLEQGIIGYNGAKLSMSPRLDEAEAEYQALPLDRVSDQVLQGMMRDGRLMVNPDLTPDQLIHAYRDIKAGKTFPSVANRQDAFEFIEHLRAWPRFDEDTSLRNVDAHMGQVADASSLRGRVADRAELALETSSSYLRDAWRVDAYENTRDRTFQTLGEYGQRETFKDTGMPAIDPETRRQKIAVNPKTNEEEPVFLKRTNAVAQTKHISRAFFMTAVAPWRAIWKSDASYLEKILATVAASPVLVAWTILSGVAGLLTGMLGMPIAKLIDYIRTSEANKANVKKVLMAIAAILVILGLSFVSFGLIWLPTIAVASGALVTKALVTTIVALGFTVMYLIYRNIKQKRQHRKELAEARETPMVAEKDGYGREIDELETQSPQDSPHVGMHVRQRKQRPSSLHTGHQFEEDSGYRSE